MALYSSIMWIYYSLSILLPMDIWVVSDLGYNEQCCNWLCLLLNIYTHVCMYACMPVGCVDLGEEYLSHFSLDIRVTKCWRENRAWTTLRILHPRWEDCGPVGTVIPKVEPLLSSRQSQVSWEPGPLLLLGCPAASLRDQLDSLFFKLCGRSSPPREQSCCSRKSAAASGIYNVQRSWGTKKEWGGGLDRALPSIAA